MESAEKKILSGIKRVRTNQENIIGGKPISTNVEGMGKKKTRTLKSGVVVEEEEY